MSGALLPGIRTLTMSYLMDNGIMDDAPKLALNQYAPNWGGNNALLRQAASTTGAEAQQATGGSLDGGNQMTPFEKESRPGAAANAPEHQQTQSEKEMREATRNNAAGQTPGEPKSDGLITQSQFSGSKADRSFLEPQPNGDLRIGDDLFIRWKPLPDVGNAIVEGIIGSAVPGGAIGKFFGGYGAEKYVEDQFRYPWLTHEPENKPVPPADSTKDQVPNA